LLRGHTHTLTPLPQHPYLNTLTLTPSPQHPYLDTLTLTPLPQHPHLNTLTLTLTPNLNLILIPTTMAHTEKEWAVMASKYGYRINADEATKDELVEFVETMMYLTQDLIDNSLWAVF